MTTLPNFQQNFKSKISYKEYLNTEHWKKKREEVFIRQGKRCRVCHSTFRLEIHHRRYKYKGESLLFKEINTNLIPLCHKCHFLWHELHGFKKIPFPRLRALIKAGIPRITVFQHPYTKAKTLLKFSDQVGRPLTL